MSCHSALQMGSVEESLTSARKAARYVICADIEPSVLPRILENFALRNLTPLHFAASQENDELIIEVAVDGLSKTEEAHLELRLQNILPVRTVSLISGS